MGMLPWNSSTAPRRWTVKVGSNVLSKADGSLDPERIRSIADQIAALRAQGIEVILVTSGAVAAGIGILGLGARPTQVPRLQAVAAIGQGALMARYAEALAPHRIVPAQVLLTYGDMADARRHLNVRQALAEMLRAGALPIINENDTTTVDELKFGDNDMLAAMVASKLQEGRQANLLVILSSVAGLLRDTPGGTREVVPVVERIADVETLVFAGKSSFGSGGMAGKLAAVRHAVDMGVPVFIGAGREPRMLLDVLEGTAHGTFFHAAKGRPRTNRDHWIATRRPAGALTVDDGARAAVLAGRSLLPVGVTAIDGDFQRGDVVEVRSSSGDRIALGIASYDAARARMMRGMRATEIASRFGPMDYDELIHANDMTVVGG
jgi:glutamate 5-kinase